MNYKEVIIKLNEYKTKKGNYKRDGVIKILEEIFNNENTTWRICPSCNGKGEEHYPCAFGGSGDWHKCKVCNGIGKI